MKTSKNNGFTLLEMMITIAIFTIVMGALYTMSLAMGRTHQVQDAKFQAVQEARRGILMLAPMIAQASRQSIDIGADGGDVGDTIAFQMADDMDGNGTAVNVSGSLEVSGVWTVSVNDDEQLILTDEDGNETVLANSINPGTEIGTGVLGEFDVSNDDANGNGRQDLGFVARRIGGRILIEIGTLSTTPSGYEAVAQIQQFITPRNR